MVLNNYYMALVKCQILKHPFKWNNLDIHLVWIQTFMMWQYEIFITMYGLRGGWWCPYFAPSCECKLIGPRKPIGLFSAFYFVSPCARCVSDCMAAAWLLVLYSLYDTMCMTLSVWLVHFLKFNAIVGPFQLWTPIELWCLLTVADRKKHNRIGEEWNRSSQCNRSISSSISWCME